MPRLPVVNGSQLVKILIKSGFVLNRISGSHHILINPQKQITVSIPVHKGRTLGKGITMSIIKDAGLTVEEFLKLK